MLSVQCNGVRKRFDGVVALDGVDLQVSGAGLTAIIGPNGAGKTTLFNVITGFLRPDGGNVVLDGANTTRWPPYRIARSGLARSFQDLRLVLEETVLVNVLLAFPRQSGEGLFAALSRIGVGPQEAANVADAERILEFLRLSEHKNALASAVSYGQQKLLTLACCVATGAHTLLLDEPVAGVHPDLAESIMVLLREIAGRGSCVVFIEHDIAAVRQADRVVVMDDGKIIADGSPTEILARPEIMDAYVA